MSASLILASLHFRLSYIYIFSFSESLFTFATQRSHRVAQRLLLLFLLFVCVCVWYHSNNKFPFLFRFSKTDTSLFFFFFFPAFMDIQYNKATWWQSRQKAILILYIRKKEKEKRCSAKMLSMNMFFHVCIVVSQPYRLGHLWLLEYSLCAIHGNTNSSKMNSVRSYIFYTINIEFIYIYIYTISSSYCMSLF